LFIGQLENQYFEQNLSLQKLWFYLQPSMKKFQLLNQLTIETKDFKGGKLLSTIYEKFCKTRGDPQIASMMEKILETTCKPYFEMIEKWIFQGIIQDPYDEFLIVQNDFQISNSKLNFNFLTLKVIGKKNFT
jgi:gamma-tubulin complex component 2